MLLTVEMRFLIFIVMPLCVNIWKNVKYLAKTNIRKDSHFALVYIIEASLLRVVCVHSPFSTLFFVTQVLVNL